MQIGKWLASQCHSRLRCIFDVELRADYSRPSGDCRRSMLGSHLTHYSKSSRRSW